jgi:hypothetical protein
MSLPPDDQPGEPGAVPILNVDPRRLPRKRITEPVDMAEATASDPWNVYGQRVYEVEPDQRAKRLDV